MKKDTFKISNQILKSRLIVGTGKYKSFKENMTVPESSFFFARGPMGLKGAKEYAAFSKDFYEGYDRSEELLNYPERVSEDAYVALSSALWKFMEPMNNGPSSHSVMTGFYVPNASDNQAGHKDGFGTTTFAIAKELCSDWNKSQGSKDRADYFNDMLEDLEHKNLD